MRSCFLFLALILAALDSWAGQQELVTVSDPAGDDFGSGTLVYPQRSDYRSGDLDLLQLKVSRDNEGFWFESIFKNAIRDPASVPNTVGGESLGTFARKGFYQFNIDIYVDTDRIRGSGNTFAASGRQVQIDPAYAWERAVILTPRPELMRQQLLDVLAEQYPDRSPAETVASVDQSMFFPTRIRVRGKSIAFFVPATFFSGSDGTDWAVTALVTGAMTSIPTDLSFFSSTRTPLERLALGVMQPDAGYPIDTFGYSGALPGPVVDMLSPTIAQQARQLAARMPVTGVSWGPHAANDVQAVVVAVAKEETKPMANDMPKPVAPLGDLIQPKTAAAPQPAPAIEPPAVVQPAPATEPVAATRPAARVEPVAAVETATSTQDQAPADAPIARRLQTLQQLYDRKLIDESEYRQQKQRILNEL
jgi:hypothetical protein